QVGTLSFQLVPDDSMDNRRAPIPVEIQTQLVAGQLADGDEVEVSGVWDGRSLDADTIVNLSAGARPKRGSPRVRAKTPRDKAPTRRTSRKVALFALVGVIVVVAASVLWFTDGFGIWSRPGPIVKPVSATVFSPSGSPDNPQKAGLAID